MKRVLVANRGTAAARVLRAVRSLGLESVAVYSHADADLPYLREADQTFCLGDPAPAASYLNQKLLLDIVKRSGADAVHPGYGFLSENAEFARRVQDLDVNFIGPSPRWIQALGDKVQARRLMAKTGMPMSASSSLLGETLQSLQQAIAEIGLPVLVKPSGGGGGIGMLPIRSIEEAERVWTQARSLALRNFGAADVYLEKLIDAPRHIEFQFLADRYGGVRSLLERDCSVQRRNQKVVEEAPAPNLPRGQAQHTAALITDILARLGYDVIGTVEMLYHQAAGFMFLEVNTRLQVEHAVTEAITGIDIVSAQILLAGGQRIDEVLPASIEASGHAVEARIYAEDPRRFIPSPGRLDVFRPPCMEGIRVETGYAEGCRVTSYYDPMVAKVIAHGADRGEAVASLAEALRTFEIRGVETNIPFILNTLENTSFRKGGVDTGIAAEVSKQMQSEVEAARL